MKTWKGYGTLALIVVIAALLPVLAALQYHWQGELSRLERKQMLTNVQSAARRYSFDLCSELARLYQTFHLRAAEEQPAPIALKTQFESWVSTSAFPELVASAYWVEPNESGELDLSKVDFKAGRFVPSEWPSWLTIDRAAFAVSESDDPEREPEPVDPLQGNIPALVVHQHGDPAPWAVVVLDLEVMAEDFVASHVTHFAGGVELDYDFAIVEEDDRDKVIYVSGPNVLASELSRHEDTFDVPFFGLHSRDFRSDWIEGLPTGATAHQLRLYIRQHPGSVEAAVGDVRTRNLLVSSGILVLLGVSILLLLVSTRRAERWARQQLEYVAQIAHELRTPLAVIGFASENLTDDVVTDLEKAKTYGQVIRTESRRLSKLVESALMYSKLESNPDATADYQAVRISDVIDSALSDSDASELSVEKDIDADLPAVLGDGEALKSALQNLLNNAIKYGEPPHHVAVSAKGRGNGKGKAVEITISDRGRGIPDADLPHIFEPFYRGRSASAEQIEGSGIGLSLVKHVVDAHRGSIRVVSSEGKGSTFTLRLPAGA